MTALLLPVWTINFGWSNTTVRSLVQNTNLACVIRVNVNTILEEVVHWWKHRCAKRALQKQEIHFTCCQTSASACQGDCDFSWLRLLLVEILETVTLVDHCKILWRLNPFVLQIRLAWVTCVGKGKIHNPNVSGQFWGARSGFWALSIPQYGVCHHVVCPHEQESWVSWLCICHRNSACWGWLEWLSSFSNTHIYAFHLSKVAKVAKGTCVQCTQSGRGPKSSPIFLSSDAHRSQPNFSAITNQRVIADDTMRFSCLVHDKSEVTHDNTSAGSTNPNLELLENSNLTFSLIHVWFADVSVATVLKSFPILIWSILCRIWRLRCCAILVTPWAHVLTCLAALRAARLNLTRRSPNHRRDLQWRRGAFHSFVQQAKAYCIHSLRASFIPLTKLRQKGGGYWRCFCHSTTRSFASIT